MFTVPLTLRGDVRPLIASGVLVALPTVTTMLQAGLSRSREYDADLEAAALTGDPEGLASALEVLESLEGRVWERLMVPHGRRPDPLVPRAHPSSADRARRLRELAPDDARAPASPLGGGQMIPPQGLRPGEPTDAAASARHPVVTGRVSWPPAPPRRVAASRVGTDQTASDGPTALRSSPSRARSGGGRHECCCPRPSGTFADWHLAGGVSDVRPRDPEREDRRLGTRDLRCRSSHC